MSSRGARSRLEYGIETTTSIDTTPKTTIRSLSRQQQSTSIVVPLPDQVDAVRALITQYGIDVQPYGLSWLVKARATSIKTVLERAGIPCRITDPLTTNQIAA